MPVAKKLLQNVEFSDNSYDAAKDADAIAIVTEWQEFFHLDLSKIAKAMRGNIVVDLRNTLDKNAIIKAGFIYHGIGQPE